MLLSFPACRAVQTSAVRRGGGIRGGRGSSSSLGGLVAASLLFSAAVVAAAETTTLLNDAASGIKVEIEGWAGISSGVDGRDAGLLPLVLVVSNDSTTDQLWSIGPGRGYGRSTGVVPMASLRVPAKSSARATVYIDINAVDYGQYTPLAVVGPGYTRDFTISGVGSSASGGSTVPLPTAVSQGVSGARGDAFNAYATTGGGLDLSRPPEDWRGWSSFTSLLMTDGEWLALPGNSRAAVLGWVALGGRLGVLVADSSADRLDRLRFPRSGPDGRRRVGRGRSCRSPGMEKS